jgi:chromosome segregation ATPase
VLRALAAGSPKHGSGASAAGGGGGGGGGSGLAKKVKALTRLMSATGGARSRGAAADAGDPEKQYVDNLKQQVQVMELELQLANEKARAAAKTPESLENVLRALRGKYAEVEEKNKQARERLAQEVDKLEGEKRQLAAQLQQQTESAAELRRTNEALRGELDLERRSYLQAKNDMEQRTARAEERAKTKGAELEKLRASHKQLLRDSQLESQQLGAQLLEKSQQLTDLTADKAQLEKLLHAAQVQMVELSDKDEALSRNRELEKQLAALQSEKVALSVELKKAILGLERSEASLKKQTQISEQLLEETRKLQAQLQSVNVQMTEQKRRWESNDKRGELWSDRVATLESERQRLTQQLNRYPEQVRQLQKALDATREELAEASSTAFDCKHRLREVEEEARRLADQADKTEQALRTATVERDLLTQQALELREELRDAQTRLESLQKKHAAVVAAHERAEAKLQLSRHLEELEMDKFQNMLQSNLKVASTLEGLISAAQRISATREPPSSPTASAAAFASAPHTPSAAETGAHFTAIHARPRSLQVASAAPADAESLSMAAAPQPVSLPAPQLRPSPRPVERRPIAPEPVASFEAPTLRPAARRPEPPREAAGEVKQPDADAKSDVLLIASPSAGSIASGGKFEIAGEGANAGAGDAADAADPDGAVSEAFEIASSHHDDGTFEIASDRRAGDNERLEI